MGEAPSTDRAARWRGALFAFGCAAIAGSGFPMGKAAGLETPRSVFLFFLCISSAVFTGVWHVVAYRGKLPRLDRSGTRLMLAQSAFSFVGVWLIWKGIPVLEPAVASFIGRSETLVALFVAVLFLGERFTLGEVVGAGIAIGGLAIVHWAQSTGSLDLGSDAALDGFWFMLLGASVLGASELCSKLAVATAAPTAFTTYRSLLMGLAFGGVALARGEVAWPGGRQVLLACGVGILMPGLARTMFMYSLKSLDLSKSVLITQSQPVFAAIVAVIWLGTWPGPGEWLGGMMLIAGGVMIVMARGRNAVAADA